MEMSVEYFCGSDTALHGEIFIYYHSLIISNEVVKSNDETVKADKLRNEEIP